MLAAPVAAMNDIGQWLERLGLGKYAAVFAANDIDSEVLPHLTEQDLEKLGVSLGHRKKLLRAVAHPSAQYSPQVRPRSSTPVAGERRQLTLLFCDLVDSTVLSTLLDIEDLGDVINAFHRVCAETIELLEGHVAKYLGDGILAYFGYPRAQEDDAERAVRAGLALVHAIRGLDVGHRLHLHIRVGIATGSVIVGQLTEGAAHEPDVVGETANLAARLQAFASPDAVVIGPTTHRLVAGVFDCEDLGRQELKGFAEPVQAWRVASKGSAEGRFAARKAVGLISFVGRERELARLMNLWRLAKEGHGQIVLVRGEAGIGKSRLVEELEGRLADQRHLSMRFHCSPHHRNTALYPVMDQLERSAGFASDDPPERKLDKLETLLGQSTVAVPSVVPIFATLLSIPLRGRYPPVELVPRRLKERTLQALAGQVASLADRDPVLLLFEDAHWIDPTSLELLGVLADRLAILSALVIVTCRPEFRIPWADRPCLVELPLDRLSRGESATVARGVSRKGLPAEVLNRIVSMTDGIPLFVEELTKTVLEAGFLSDGGERYALAGPLPQFAIPATLHDSLLARLDRLGPAKEIAQVAACIGRDFPCKVLSAVVSCPRREAQVALDRLVASGLVVRRDAQTETGVNYAFRHALFRDAAYGTLLRAKRQYLHRLIGEAIEYLFGNQLDKYAGILGHHFEQAKASQKAAFYFEMAGDRAASAFANAEGIAFYEAALAQQNVAGRPEQQADRSPAAAIDLGEKMGDVLGVTGRHDEARDAYQTALARCAKVETERRSRLNRKIGQTWTRQRHDHDSALIAYTEAEAALGPEPAEGRAAWRREWLQIQLDRMMALYLQNSTIEIEQLVVRISPLINRYGSPAQRGQFYQGVVAAAYRRDRYVISDETLRAAKASVDAYCETDMPSEQQCLAQFSLGFNYLWRGELDEAEAMMRDALTLAERIGDAANRVLCLTYLTLLYRKQGRVDDARRLIALSRAACDEARMPGYAAVADANEAWLAWREGDPSSAQVKASAALDAMNAWSLVYPFLWVALWPLVGTAVAQGETEQAVGHARAMLQETQQLVAEPPRGDLETAIAAWEAGSETLAREHLERAVTAAMGLGFL